jgi:hypothetical protein
MAYAPLRRYALKINGRTLAQVCKFMHASVPHLSENGRDLWFGTQFAYWFERSQASQV